MGDEVARFSIRMEHLEGYEYKVKFDWPQSDDLLMDEPAPLGGQKGPNAVRLLAAAVGNCLSASLVFCNAKHEPPGAAVKTEVECTMIRDERQRMRIGNMDVRITVADTLEQSVRMKRCLDLFESYCVVTESVRNGIPVQVKVVNGAGEVLAEG